MTAAHRVGPLRANSGRLGDEPISTKDCGVGCVRRLYRNPHAVVATYGFRSARNVSSRLHFVQTNTSLCFPKVRSAGLISLSCNSPPHTQRNEGGGSTRGRM